jgi:DNA-binding CsgD family transcriptional regulator
MSRRGLAATPDAALSFIPKGAKTMTQTTMSRRQAPLEGRMRDRPAVAALARIIAAIGNADFMASAALSIADVIGFERATFFLHGTRDQALPLFDNFDQGREGLENYDSHTFRCNPMLAQSTGIFRAQDFFRTDAKVDEAMGRYIMRSPQEELGFRTLGWPENLEEVGLYMQACGGIIELSFYRGRSSTPMPGRTLREFEELRAPLAAAFERHMALARTPKSAVTVPRAVLSPRERQIVGLILLGYSSEAIGHRLDISLYTVKDHRKKIFRKLGISSIAELFILDRELGIGAPFSS